MTEIVHSDAYRAQLEALIPDEAEREEIQEGLDWVLGHDPHRRRERIARASQQLEELASRLAGPKPRLRAKHEIHTRIDAILASNKITPYLKVELQKTERHTFKQTKRGRPGPKTEYKRETKAGWRLTWAVDDAAIAIARASDFTAPRTLLINCVRDRTSASRDLNSAKSACARSLRCWTGARSLTSTRARRASFSASRRSLLRFPP